MDSLASLEAELGLIIDESNTGDDGNTNAVPSLIEKFESLAGLEDQLEFLLNDTTQKKATEAPAQETPEPPAAAPEPQVEEGEAELATFQPDPANVKHFETASYADLSSESLEVVGQFEFAFNELVCDETFLTRVNEILQEMFQGGHSEEVWSEISSVNDFELVRMLAGAAKTHVLRGLPSLQDLAPVAQILFMFAGLHPEEVFHILAQQYRVGELCLIGISSITAETPENLQIPWFLLLNAIIAHVGNQDLQVDQDGLLTTLTAHLSEGSLSESVQKHAISMLLSLDDSQAKIYRLSEELTSEEIVEEQICAESSVLACILKHSEKDSDVVHNISTIIVDTLNHTDATTKACLPLIAFVTNVFESRNSEFFYTSDIKVIFDVLLRWLDNAQEGSNMVGVHLDFLDALLDWPAYGEVQCRNVDIIDALHALLGSATDRDDQPLAKHISAIIDTRIAVLE